MSLPGTTPPHSAAAGPLPWAAELHASARPLIVLAAQWRTQVPADPAAALDALAGAVERFEAQASAARFDARSVTVASYLLCCWLDESLAAVAGAARVSLLERFHREPAGGERLFALLERLAQREQARAGSERPLLELAYACLSLGLQGPALDGRQRDAWRARLAQLLALGPSANRAPLASHWQGAVPERSRAGGAGLGGAALLALALAVLGVFGSSQWLLASQSAAMFASLQGLEQHAGQAPLAGAPLASAQSAAAAPVRLVAALAVEARQPGFSVRDEAHRSVVTLDIGGLFEPDTTQLTSARMALLARVADVLAEVRAATAGRVLVTAYAASDAARPARLASAWDLADEWARHVTQCLELRLPPGSLNFEGRAEPAGAAAASRGRIEITLFP